MPRAVDTVVVGAGPNGLAAAIQLARAGRSVLVLEAADTVGGGCRSAELTLPGFVHDVCSAVHPLAAASPFFRTLPQEELGLTWVHPPLPLAHPFDDGSAAVLHRSVLETAEGLGADGPAWGRLFGPLVRSGRDLLDDLLGPLRLPHRPLALARFGLRGLWSARALAARFRTEPARGLLAGLAGHSVLPFRRFPSGAVALVMGTLAHLVGWPLAQGGSQRIADALASCARALGVEVRTGARVASLRDLPEARAILFDLSPRPLLQVAGEAFPSGYRRALERFRYGPGAFKVDWALDGPIPWKAEACSRAGTVHLGGTFEEVAAAEEAAWRGEVPERPFVILAQPSLFDSERAPSGRHTAWAYCHVPNGCPVDMTERIEAQVERFAPGFRDRVLARHVMSPADLERHNPNYVGGDIVGGAMSASQLLTRPVPRLDPYATPDPRLFVCSSSTPPGAGVHGMCGYHAARSALRRALA
ncbi:MAG TPA: NAD(P)/FAD-dependent oxidoreductase [Actinomycetota bacterium]|nr:NAD(P)/FAD-dependent oxidoreductase [Actinomycetota bacterium]